MSEPEKTTGPALATAPSSSTNVDSVMEKVIPNRKLYWLLTGSTIAVYAGFTLGAAATWYSFIGPTPLNWGPLWLLTPIAHLFGFSLKKVDANELGAMYWYGECVARLNPGLHFVPASPFTNVVTRPHDTQEILAPGPRDKIYWGEEDSQMPVGMVRPIFLNTRAPTTEETKPLDVQLQVGVSFEVIWVVDDVPTFLKNMHTVPEADSQIRGISVTALSEVLGEGTADDAISGQTEVNRKFLKRLQDLTENWGVKIRRANLTSINTSHKLASAMRDRAESVLRAETTRIEATAARDADILRSEGVRAQAAAELIGRAEGMAASARVLSTPGSEVLAAETLRAVAPHANMMVFGETGLNQLGAAATMLGVGLKAGEKASDTTEKGTASDA